jgi:hypothetical protein
MTFGSSSRWICRDKRVTLVCISAAKTCDVMLRLLELACSLSVDRCRQFSGLVLFQGSVNVVPEIPKV